MLAGTRRNLATVAVTGAAVLGVAAAPAGAAGNNYPDALVKQFVTSCTKTAVASSDGQLTRAQARTYCRAAIKCIERNLTLKEFEQYVKRQQSGASNPGAKKVNKCIKQAAQAASGAQS
jgi:hypothetical protein